MKRPTHYTKVSGSSEPFSIEIYVVFERRESKRQHYDSGGITYRLALRLDRWAKALLRRPSFVRSK
jgi:hypothetical protein